jgi:hypothetical protein
MNGEAGVRGPGTGGGEGGGERWEVLSQCTDAASKLQHGHHAAWSICVVDVGKKVATKVDNMISVVGPGPKALQLCMTGPGPPPPPHTAVLTWHVRDVALSWLQVNSILSGQVAALWGGSGKGGGYEKGQDGSENMP